MCLGWRTKAASSFRQWTMQRGRTPAQWRAFGTPSACWQTLPRLQLQPSPGSMGAWRRQKPLMGQRVCLGREGSRSKALAMANRLSQCFVSLATQIACHVEASAVTRPRGNPDFFPFSLFYQWHFGSWAGGTCSVVNNQLIAKISRFKLCTSKHITEISNISVSFATYITLSRFKYHQQGHTFKKTVLTPMSMHFYLTGNSSITFVVKLRYLKNMEPSNSLPRMVTKIIFCQYLCESTNSGTLQNAVTPRRIHVRYPTVAVYCMVELILVFSWNFPSKLHVLHYSSLKTWWTGNTPFPAEFWNSYRNLFGHKYCCFFLQSLKWESKYISLV